MKNTCFAIEAILVEGFLLYVDYVCPSRFGNLALRLMAFGDRTFASGLWVPGSGLGARLSMKGLAPAPAPLLGLSSASDHCADPGKTCFPEAPATGLGAKGIDL